MSARASEADELHAVAEFAEACLLDLEDEEVPLHEWRAAAWAMTAFYEIARDLSWEATRLEREMEDEWRPGGQ